MSENRINGTYWHSPEMYFIYEMLKWEQRDPQHMLLAITTYDIVSTIFI